MDVRADMAVDTEVDEEAVLVASVVDEAVVVVAATIAENLGTWSVVWLEVFFCFLVVSSAMFLFVTLILTGPRLS